MVAFSREQVRKGQMEGRGWWSNVKKWVKGAVKTAGKYVKDHHLVSRALGAASDIASTVPGNWGKAGKYGLSIAAKGAKQAGWGPSRKCKNISKAQVEAMRGGFAVWLPSGGISLALARRHLNPNIKNISKAQVNALHNHHGRSMKGGGISLGGGGPSGYYAVTRTARNISGRGISLPSGSGLKLAGQGKRKKAPKIPAFGGGRKRRKPAVRRKPVLMY